MTLSKPRLSVVIPWCNRLEIETTLQRNRHIFGAHDAEVVVVNCGGDAVWLRKMLLELSMPGLRWIDLADARFNKSLAINLGVFTARAEHLFFLDADVIFKEDFLSDALQLLNKSCFVTVDRVFESQSAINRASSHLRELSHSIEFIGHRYNKVRIETNHVRLYDGSRSAPGLALLTRERFLEVDGMNSELEGWGWEDLDLLVRLQLALSLHRYQVGAVVHLTHSDELRDLRDRTRTASETRNFSICLANYSLGHYYGTYTDDAARWKERLVMHELM